MYPARNTSDPAPPTSSPHTDEGQADRYGYDRTISRSAAVLTGFLKEFLIESPTAFGHSIAASTPSA
ncbi:hypothetical protein [Actinacidiphila yeochonensis]|uniref:hypothetical protein n=1 Tax=Actinacidiphila yeochonensis TaxID=89050 RepID=UPI000B01A948|nr:hypothetical protein [Actinacidiphila yeochonensis]